VRLARRTYTDTLSLPSQKVVKLHFETTLNKQKQPHTLALHLDFLRRTDTGPATFKVQDVKLGRQTSVVHVALSQGEREEVVG
jgi:acyl-coenzyme A thioesterase PaaI-like protein